METFDTVTEARYHSLKNICPAYGLKQTAFRMFGQDVLYTVLVLFSADVAQGDIVQLPATGIIENRRIKGITSPCGELGFNSYDVNGINYTVISSAQAANFTLNFYKGEEPLFDDFPLSRICDQTSGLSGNILATDFIFHSDTSWIKKAGSAVIAAPYCIPLVFAFDAKR